MKTRVCCEKLRSNKATRNAQRTSLSSSLNLTNKLIKLLLVMGYTGVKKKDVEIDRGLNFYS